MEDPPIGLKSPVTLKPVLAGLVPGVTLTVKVMLCPATTALEEVVTTPEGLAWAWADVATPDNRKYVATKRVPVKDGMKD